VGNRGRSKLEALKAVPLFRGCSTREVSRIAALMAEHEVRAGEVLAREGRPGHSFFVIVDGDAEITLRGRRIAVRGPGEHFGEMALLDHGPRAATVVARTPMRLYVLEAREFARVLRSTPAVAAKMLAELSGRLREAVDAPRARRADVASLF
jgi:CRP-like cAMP-binding protein